MKVGILTIYGGTNYGNKLQNYALQHFLISNGIDVETIRYTVSIGHDIKGLDKIRLLKRKYFSSGLKETIWNLEMILQSKIFHNDIRKKTILRTQKFKQFESNRIILSEHIFESVDELEKSSVNYDKIIVGSDQVWNPYWQGSRDEFFLSFLPEEKRVAYAPSIGIDSVPLSMHHRLKQLWGGFSKLSCRDINGCEIIKKISGRACAHVCDPVFLLSPDKWKAMTKKCNNGYIATYFLGGETSETHKMIKEYAIKNKLEIIDLWSEKNHKSKFVGIEEFLSYIANAEVFFTDSFHGCAFSIIFKTQFVICERRIIDSAQVMSSRIKSLMEKLEITDYDMKSLEKNKNRINFENVHCILSQWSDESQEFLLQCLE